MLGVFSEKLVDIQKELKQCMTVLKRPIHVKMCNNAKQLLKEGL